MEQLKKMAIADLYYLKEDFDYFVNSTRKYKKSPLEKKYGLNFQELFLSFNDMEQKSINNKRKDRKYAGFIVELYAIVEQLLDKLYFYYYERKFKYTRESKENKSILLQQALKGKLDFEHEIQESELINARNIIIHEDFSAKYTRAQLKESMKSRKFVNLLIEDVWNFIEGIEENQDK